MTIKVLPLQYWMSDVEMLADCRASGSYPVVSPRFNRPGVYLLGAECWFETTWGDAYRYPAQDFRYELALLDAERLNHHQVHALQAVCAQRLATTAQRQLLRHYEDAMQIRQVYRDSLKHSLCIRHTA